MSPIGEVPPWAVLPFMSSPVSFGRFGSLLFAHSRDPKPCAPAPVDISCPNCPNWLFRLFAFPESCRPNVAQRFPNLAALWKRIGEVKCRRAEAAVIL